MRAQALLRALTGTELRNVRRDSMLSWLAAFPILTALLLGWLVPLTDANLEVDLRPYYLLIMSVHAVLAAPVLIGFIVGMLLLDERDDGTLQAIRVTPLPMSRYLAWKLCLPVAVTTVLTLVGIRLADLIPFQFNYAAPALVGALWAPLLALAMVTFAKNKLQGFVLMRVLNLLILIPIAAWFLEAHWDPLLMVFPAFWPLKAFQLAARGESYLPHCVIGAIYYAALTVWLYRRCRQVLGRAG